MSDDLIVPVAPQIRQYRTLRDGLRADVGRAAAMAFAGILVFAPIEYVATLGAYTGSISLGSKLRLAALTATLALVLFLLVAIALAAVLVLVRLVRAQLDPAAARDPGLFVPTPLVDGVRRGVPRVWAAVGTAIVLGLVLQRGAAEAMVRFKEPQLTAGLIAAIGIFAAGAAPFLFRLALIATSASARALAPIFGIVNPLGRWRASGVALAGFVGGVLAIAWFVLPQSRSVLPLRTIASLVALALGMGLGAFAHGGLRNATSPSPLLAELVLVFLAFVWFLLPGTGWLHPARVAVTATAVVVAMRLASGVALGPRTPRRALGIAAGALALSTSTLAYIGADLETKYVAITASPALEKLIEVVRFANDLDRDGFGTVLGEADCAPFDKQINPGATDVPDDTIDQNCDGRDFSLSSLMAPTGPTVEVPPAFKKPWNILLITVDTARYDRTSFGGYATGPKKRDTTPRLAELVNQSTSFTFANAPSAGTMASIPAILTSKFFHSGIALGDSPRGVPPAILPENVMLPEIMKRLDYATGAIGSHEWWNNWGLEQGVDDFDNSIGKTSDPYRVAADKVTDHALAWISRQQGKKWFMWAHYIDPHGRYVAHPNVVDYGSAETDLYDAELRWTDQELGRLFDELRRLPSHENTIIILTSDHGDSMAEHGIPLGTHGTALFREMLHVPLIFYIPNNVPRTIGGAVTPLDIVPTVTALCGIDVKDLAFEGRSLVPQLFAGREDKDRIVFAETNAPKHQRAAISEHWKLIYHLTNNVYELYDLTKDPWEHDNLAPKAPPALSTMRQALQFWLDRVLYARDPVFNQNYRQISDVLTTEAPSVLSENQTLANGNIEILGIGIASGTTVSPTIKASLHVYFRTKATTPTTYRFQLVAWPAVGDLTTTVPGTAIRSTLRATADGTFPTERWKVGDKIRERFEITLPPTWTADQMVLGLVAVDAKGDRVKATGPTPTNAPDIAILGVLPIAVQGGSRTPPTP